MRDPENLGQWFEELRAWDVTRGEVPREPVERIRYGNDSDQHFEIWADRKLNKSSHLDRVALSLHGGYFLQEYDSSLQLPMVRQLAADGFTVANVEYRRGAKGREATIADLDAALGLIVESVQPKSVAVFGHSAGGYLAEILARRAEVDIAVLLAPVSDLAEASIEGWDEGGIEQWMGATPEEQPEKYEAANLATSPTGGAQRVILHGDLDTAVAVEQSRRLNSALTSAGIETEFIELAGEGHYGFLDPRESAFDVLRETLRDRR